MADAMRREEGSVPGSAAGTRRLAGGCSGAELVRIGDAVEKCAHALGARRLREQAYWVFSASASVRRGFPRVLMFEWGDGRTRMAMEHLPMQPLSTELIERNADPRWSWGVLREALQWVHTTLHHDRRPAERSWIGLLTEQVRDRCREGKLAGRLGLLVRSPRVRVNGRSVRGLLAALEGIDRRVDQTRGLHHPSVFAVHGDLHTGNLLVSADGSFRWIDPRGGFHGGGKHFDRSYDVGKVLHDLHARYGLIRAGHFQLGVDERGGVVFEIDRDDRWSAYQYLQDRYSRWGAVHLGPDDPSWLERGVLAEALLLAGIFPFHIEDPPRAIALMSSALVLLDRWLRWADQRCPPDALLAPTDRWQDGEGE